MTDQWPHLTTDTTKQVASDLLGLTLGLASELKALRGPRSIDDLTLQRCVAAEKQVAELCRDAELGAAVEGRRSRLVSMPTAKALHTIIHTMHNIGGVWDTEHRVLVEAGIPLRDVVGLKEHTKKAFGRHHRLADDRQHTLTLSDMAESLNVESVLRIGWLYEELPRPVKRIRNKQLNAYVSCLYAIGILILNSGAVGEKVFPVSYAISVGALTGYEPR